MKKNILTARQEANYKNDLNAFDSFSADDFYNTTKPFERVYSLRNNPFAEEQALAKLCIEAKKAGINNIECKRLYKKYVQSLNNATLIDNDHYSDFTGQPLELNTGSWLADDFGITKLVDIGKEITACNHAILPIQRITNIDTGISKIRLAFSHGDKWKTIIVDKKTIASRTNIISLADFGIGVTSENAPALIQYLHDTEANSYNIIPEVFSVTRLGWINEKYFSPYSSDLIFDGNEQFYQMYNAVTEKGSFDNWLELVLKIRRNNSIPAKIILASSFASVLVKPLGVLPFIVHLWGGTETGKTVSLMLAASVWACPEMGKYCKTFNSTSVGQELTAGFVNSLPLIMDELQLVNSRIKNFDEMIHLLTQETGRIRGKKNGGLQHTETWKNCTLTSGEQPITSDKTGGGAVNRVIEICCEDVKLFNDPGAVVSTINNNYGHAGKAFVDLLKSDEIIALAKERYADYFKTLLNYTTEKQAMAGATILTADEITTHLIFKDSAQLTVNNIVSYLATKEDINKNLRALNWFRGWLSQNHAKFSWLPSDNKDNIYGTIKGNSYYILSHVFNNACEEAGYNSTAFAHWLKRNGYLSLDSQGNVTKAVYISGFNNMRPRCYIFTDKEI